MLPAEYPTVGLPQITEDGCVQDDKMVITYRLSDGTDVNLLGPQRLPIVKTRSRGLINMHPDKKYALPLVELLLGCNISLLNGVSTGDRQLPYELENLIYACTSHNNRKGKRMHPRFQKMGAFARAAVSDDERDIFPYWPHGIRRSSQRPMYRGSHITEKFVSPLERMFLYKLTDSRYDKFDDFIFIKRCTADVLRRNDNCTSYHSMSTHHIPSTLPSGRDYLVYATVYTHLGRLHKKVAVVDTSVCSVCGLYNQSRPNGWQRRQCGGFATCECKPCRKTTVTSSIESEVIYDDGVPVSQRIKMYHTTHNTNLQTGKTVPKVRCYDQLNYLNITVDGGSSWGWEQLDVVLDYLRTGVVARIHNSGKYYKDLKFEDPNVKLLLSDAYSYCYGKARPC